MQSTTIKYYYVAHNQYSRFAYFQPAYVLINSYIINIFICLYHNIFICAVNIFSIYVFEKTTITEMIRQVYISHMCLFYARIVSAHLLRNVFTARLLKQVSASDVCHFFLPCPIFDFGQSLSGGKKSNLIV